MRNINLLASILFVFLIAGCGGKSKNKNVVKSDSTKSSANAVCETLTSAKTYPDTTSQKSVARDTVVKKTSQNIKTNQKTAATTKLPRLWDFGSETCIPCKTMTGILTPMMQEYSGKVDIRIINVYKEQALASQYKIQVIPTQVFIDTSGQEIYRHVGVFLRDSILGKFTEFRFTE